MSDLPICECATFWPGQGHPPDCPVRREIERLRAEIERLRGVVASQLESIQNLGTAPHCPTCACRADQPTVTLTEQKP
jgi:hypothetical protein